MVQSVRWRMPPVRIYIRKAEKNESDEIISVVSTHMKMLILFPPVCDPRGPHLAPACLAAALRKAGHEVEIWDLDLELLLHLCQPGNLQRSLKKAEEKMAAIDRKGVKGYEDASYWHALFELCRSSQNLPRETSDAITILRGQEFYNRDRFKWARRKLNEALRLATLPVHPQITVRMDNPAFETPYRSDRFSDLLDAVRDDDSNLFGPLYRKHVLPRVDAYRPDAIGISILNYQQIIPGLTLAYQLRQAGRPVFIGGTVFVKLIAALQQEGRFFTFCDGVIVYEGETALLKLMKTMEGEGSLKDVPNLIFPSGGAIQTNAPFLVENINELPTPDFDGLPLMSYLAPRVVLPYNLGKGCYWGKCCFCDIPYSNMIADNGYRVKSVRLIVDQLEALSLKYKTPYFQFTDESCHPELLADIATELLTRKLDVRYICYGRFERGFTKELCRHIYRGGCRKILFGLESGCQKRLDAINKGISVQQAEAILKNCAAAGIYYRVFAMIGLPHETVDEAYETFHFFKKNSDLFLSPFNHFEFSPFHLDRHSCLGREPERYRLQLRADNEEPFSLGGWSFHTETGMDPRTVNRVYRNITGELYRLLKGDEKYSGWEEYSLLTIDYHSPIAGGVA